MLSFQKMGVTEPDVFVGFSNYSALLTNPEFYQSLKATTIFAIISIPSVLTVALLIALATNYKPIKGKVYFKVIYFLPAVTSWVTVAIVWKWFLNPSYGLINTMLGMLGLPGRHWLVEKGFALLSVGVVNLWKTAGFFMIIFLSNLQMIDPQLYDAASIDGANKWQQFKYITIYQLKPAWIVCSLLAFIWFYRVFTAVYFMTAGGPAGETNFLAYYAYIQAFSLFYFLVSHVCIP
ncbi:unnamed protein product, partial [marine sediment metagenome]